MMISLINECFLFDALDNEMLECILKREQEHIDIFLSLKERNKSKERRSR
jgi:hypothetical protein